MLIFFRSEALTNLMIEGTISPSGIKCKFCQRVFPREKSLTAHLRTHTGERPYHCDYPNCNRAFTQSGQLKTHTRLHTGERPFICSAERCPMRFTHANRHCPDHPYESLKRCDDFVIQNVPEQNVEVLKWLEKYRLEREDRTTTPTSNRNRSVKRAKQPQSNNDENEGNEFSENQQETPNLLAGESTPNTPVNVYKSSRKGLMCELDLNAGTASPLSTKTKFNQPKLIQWHDEDEVDPIHSSASSTFNPKKKWLRDAWQDDLARPLEAEIISPPNFVDPNMSRPTVLMLANKNKAIPLTDTSAAFQQPATKSPPFETNNASQEQAKPMENRKWLGALALMQLAKEDDEQTVQPINNQLAPIENLTFLTEFYDTQSVEDNPNIMPIYQEGLQEYQDKYGQQHDLENGMVVVTFFLKLIFNVSFSFTV
jgi:Zinc finger, C2H2 type